MIIHSLQTPECYDQLSKYKLVSMETYFNIYLHFI